MVVVDDLSTGNADAVPEGAEFVEADVAVAAVGCCPTAGSTGYCISLPSRWSGNPCRILSCTGTETSSRPLNLLEAVLAAGTPRLVFSSTAATYGEPESVPITEDAPTRPTNAYGATKLAIDHAITSYATAYGLAATSLRYFNVAGAYAGLASATPPRPT